MLFRSSVVGRQITVLAGPTTDTQFEVTDKWTPDNVSDALTPFYAGRAPLRDGMLMKY